MDDRPAQVPPTGRRRRRAVGPPGARPGDVPDLSLLDPEVPEVPPDDDERLRREVPPHHG